MSRRKGQTQQQQPLMTSRSSIGSWRSPGTDDVMECTNRKCGRYHTPVVRPDGGKKCTVCDGWLMTYRRRPDDFDAPPLIDLGSDREGVVGSTRDSRMLPEAYRHSGHLVDYRGRGRDLLPVLEQPGRSSPPLDDRNNVFTCDNPDVKGCPVANEKGYVVNIPLQMWDNWLFLAKHMETEWIAYLKGVQPEGEGGAPGKVYNITEMYFPRQTMAAATCEPEPGTPLQEGTIGSVHSHVEMKAFFSSVDEAHFNHPVEMVINRAGDVECRVRMKLDCGRFQRVNAKVMLQGCETQLALLAELKAQKVERAAGLLQTLQQQPAGPAKGDGLDHSESNMWQGDGSGRGWGGWG